jgi:uncharacterized DUF497 family protein
MNDIRFEWDAEKASANCEKHNVSFDEGVTVFNDPLIVTIADSSHSDSEERFISVGASVRGRLLVVVHAKRRSRTRIINCRKATPHERKTYEKLNE